MNIFSDFHHSGLYTSLQLLFEKRLGYRLYRPIGEDWFKEGYWLLSKPYNDVPETITQYLGIRDEVYQPIDGTKPLNEIKGKDGYYTVKSDPFDHKAITFGQFKKMDIDIVIASYALHIPVYANLIKKYKPNAKLIHQQGNEWEIDFTIIKNLLASVKKYSLPSDVNAVFYHQEFDLDIYKFREWKGEKIIRSFVNTLGWQDLFKKDWADFGKLYEELSREYRMESYGASCMNGVIKDQKEIADKMSESKWGFHLKTGGDGYGHVIHSWFAVGRPIIYRGWQYKHRLAEDFLIHKITGLDLDQMSYKEVADFIKEQSNSDYRQMCDNIYNRFKEVVNFDKEQKDIENFLSKLK